MAQPGDRIIYRDDETEELVAATVLAIVSERGWLEVLPEPGPRCVVEGDTPWISPELIVQVLAAPSAIVEAA